MVLTEQEPPQPPPTTQKDPRVNLRLGIGGLQAKVDYRADTAPKVPQPASSFLIPVAHTNKPYWGIWKPMLSACASWVMFPHKNMTLLNHRPLNTCPWTHLEVFAWHSQEYMVEHEEWEVCTHTPTQTVLPSQLLSDPQSKELLRVPVTTHGGPPLCHTAVI